MLTPVRSTQSKRDVRRAKKRCRDLSKLRVALASLIRQEPLTARYLDHPLRGIWKGYREAHIEPDRLLIYRVTGKERFVSHPTRAGARDQDERPRVPTADQKRQRHEVNAILARLRRQPGVILADEVGMGKTFVALAVAYSVATRSPRGPALQSADRMDRSDGPRLRVRCEWRLPLAHPMRRTEPPRTPTCPPARCCGPSSGSCRPRSTVRR